MTQKQAIEQAVFSGRKLSMMDGFRLFGTTCLHKRISELEAAYGVRLDRKPKKFKSRYGTKGMYMEYQLDTDRYKKQVRKAIKN